jgi:peptidoglycan/xylan/chitin deacetylase (PgdA/CDA1 family)
MRPASRRLAIALAAVAILTVTSGMPPDAFAAAPERCPSGIVALTFDDGPGIHTSAVLDVLARFDAPATFFVNGHRIAQQPDTLIRAHVEGHVIANHTWGHELLTALGDAAILATVRRLEADAAALGVPVIPLVRPPFMGTSARVRRVLADAGYTHILWDVDPQDWRGYAPAVIGNHVLSRLSDGAVVLFHDGSGNAAGMVAALPAILRGMAERGYCPGVLDADGGVVLPAADAMAPPADPEDTPFAEEIALLVEAGIARGCGDGRFCPHEPLSRGQLASFVTRALRFLGADPDPAGGTDCFVDDNSSVHESDINALAHVGIVPVTPSCLFEPAATVTRADAAAVLVGAFAFTPTDADWFTDDDGSAHEPAINALADAGVTLGCGDGRFCPDRTVERGEFALLLVRALGL